MSLYFLAWVAGVAIYREKVYNVVVTHGKFSNITTMSLFAIYSIFSFAMGACIASFLNVVIWRVPRNESIVSPPSHCPKCNAPIRWWQNLPILSWLALRGKCANCRAPISPRYILIETLGGVLFLATFRHFFAGGEFSLPFAVFNLLLWWIWISLMIVGTFIDFDHQLLPDFVTVGGMILGVAGSFAFWLITVLASGDGLLASMLELSPRLSLMLGWTLPVSPLYSLVGLAFGFGILWLVRYAGSKAFKREAMGMGDVFLMGAIGALFGHIAVFFCLMVSAILGSIVGIAMILLSKAKLGKFVAIPYGPYICMACLVWMFRGPQIVAWYLSLLRI